MHVHKVSEIFIYRKFDTINIFNRKDDLLPKALNPIYIITK